MLDMFLSKVLYYVMLLSVELENLSQLKPSLGT